MSLHDTPRRRLSPFSIYADAAADATLRRCIDYFENIAFDCRMSPFEIDASPDDTDAAAASLELRRAQRLATPCAPTTRYAICLTPRFAAMLPRATLCR